MRTLILASVFFVSACSHHHKEPKHHHHKDTSKISSEDHGEGQFRIDHGGEVYYFDSADEMNKFKMGLSEETRKKLCHRRGRQLVCPES